jgi:hypothetical protein
MASIECIRYTPINKNHCLGIATIFVPKWGVEINGITLLQKDGRRWISFPSKQYEKDGEKKYMPYFRFPNADHYNLFCQAVKEAIERHAQTTADSDNQYVKEESLF